MNSPITFITGNAAKAEQLAHHLRMPIEHKKLDLPEIQSLDLDEVVRDKARRAWDILRTPVLVEDVSLTFTAMGRLPGPLIKWFLQELGNDGLTRLLDGKDRSAVSEVRYALHDGIDCHVFTGTVPGRIADAPKGESSFGWEVIFIPEGYEKTRGAMTEDERNESTMRRPALAKLQAFLESRGS